MTLRKKFIIALLTIGIVPLSLAFLTANYISEKIIKGDAYQQLSGISSLQKERIDQVLDFNRERLALVASRTKLRISLDDYMKFGKEEDLAMMRRILKDAAASVQGIENILILSMDGTLIASLNRDIRESDFRKKDFYLKGIDEIHISPASYEDGEFFYISGPLLLAGKKIGVVVIICSMDSIYKIISDYAGLGNSGESYLTNTNGIIISPVRFEEEGEGKPPIDISSFDSCGSEADEAITSKNTNPHIIETKDYSDRNVLAHGDFIKSLDLCLITQVRAEEAFKLLHDLRIAISLILLATMVFIVILAFLIVKGTAGQIRLLRDGIKKIGNGHLDHRTSIMSKDEIGDLSKSFDSMAEKLEDAQRRLKNWNEELEERVRQKTFDLKETQEKLLNSEKLALMGKITGMVAHELRTPISAIKNSVYFVRRKLDTAMPNFELINKHLDLMDVKIIKASKFITETLNYGKIQREDISTANLDDILEGCLEQAGVPDNVKVIFELNSGKISLECDHNQLEHIFVNVFNNAFDAMPDGGTLNVKTKIDGDNTHIEITDTGSGIPQKVQGDIFEPLFTTKDHGIGFGLAITKGLVEGHGGTIHISSDDGKGTKVTIVLPLKQGVKDV